MSEVFREAVKSNDPRVQAALNEYFAKVDRGESVEIEPFVAQHAAVADELRSLIAVDENARRMARGLNPKPAAPSRSKAEVSTHSVVGKLEQTSPGKPVNVAASCASKPVVAKSPHDLPDTFGRYRIEKKLGAGAMGAVYLAHDTLLDRQVALKTPTFENDDDGELMKRFYREARAVSKIKHHNLCGVYDVGEINGRHYISMEFVPGKKLTEFIKPDKPMTEKQAMAVVRKIALAMHEAHSHGVIHRDLKPDNIMVNEKGEPVVMDFGLVHQTDSQNSTQLSQRGSLIGSPAYMSKEQVEGDHEKLTGATDQYSLGVILYQLLTSKLPFEGGIHAVLGAILTKEPPPPSTYRPDLNPHLEAVCLKMMAKDASNRFPSMKAAADALAEVGKGTSKAAGSITVPSPTVGSFTDGLTATFTGIPVAADQYLPTPLELQSKRFHLLGFIAKQPKSILYGSLAAGLVLLLAVTLWFRSGDALVKIVVLSDDIHVTIHNDTITLADGQQEVKTDGQQEVKTRAGQHTLHIKSGSIEFDTDKFTLKKGKNRVVTVELVNSKVIARFGDTNIGSLQISPQAGERRVVIMEGVEFAFRWCPPGQFQMGTPTDEAEHQDDETQVEIVFRQGFWILETEVTQEMYFAVTQARPWRGEESVHEGSTYPAAYVTWQDATDFCETLTIAAQREGILTVKEKITLPTEAQWEYAARANTTTAYFFGNDASPLGDYAWHDENTQDIDEQCAHQVGQKKANPWGLRDITGNVSEWCSDWYADELLGGTNPTGQASGSSRVRRGGSLSDDSTGNRVGFRLNDDPTNSSYNVGFRVVRVIEDSTAQAEGVQNSRQITIDSTNQEMPKQIGIHNGDFSDGLDGWEIEGGAANFRVFTLPTGESSALTTFGTYSDDDTGRLFQTFYVAPDAAELEFYVHGGRGPGVYVALSHDGRVFKRVSGRNQNADFCFRVVWDIISLRGKMVTLEIVDEIPGYYGYIGAHGFRIISAQE